MSLSETWVGVFGFGGLLWRNASKAVDLMHVQYFQVLPPDPLARHVLD